MKLLIVEDDKDVRLLLEAWFYDKAHIVVRSNGASVTTDDILDCDAVLADFMLPYIDGCQFLKRVAEMRPSLRRVLWTAAGAGVACEHAHVIVYKPATVEELMEALNG